MAMLVILAVAGAFGDGLLSHARILTANGSSMTFNRVMRSDNPERVLLSGRAPRGTVTLAIDSTTLSWLRLESTVPRAIAERRGAGQLELDMTPSADGTVAVELTVTAYSVGIHQLRTKLGEGAWSDARVVVLP